MPSESNDAVPTAEKDDPHVVVPDWLPKPAKVIFLERAKQMIAAEYWSPRYSDALALYASLAIQYRENPIGCSAAKVTQMRLLLSELGLTPQSARGVTQ
jgi:phage terminase small subunit